MGSTFWRLGYVPVAECRVVVWAHDGGHMAKHIGGAGLHDRHRMSGSCLAAVTVSCLPACLPAGTAFPPLLRDLRAVGAGRPVIALQGKHLSQCFQWRRAPSADDVARATAALLQRLGYRRACLMGHSYGTFYVARTCALFPEVSGGQGRRGWVGGERPGRTNEQAGGQWGG